MSGKIPKYLRVKAVLLDDIRAGRRRAGDQLPTREKLIRHFKVTRTTLDRALSELLREGALKSSRRLGTFVTGHRPAMDTSVVSPLAEYVAPLPGAEPNDLQRMFGSMLLAARRLNVRLAFHDEKEVRGRPTALAGHEAVIWVQPDDATLERLKTAGGRVLVTNRYPAELGFVSTHHRQAMREATEHLLRKGGKQARVFYLDPEREGFVFRERREGFVEACEKHQRFYRICHLDWSFDVAYRAVLELAPDSRSTLIIVAPVMHYCGAMFKAAAEQGRRYGQRLLYADFDNTASMSRYGFQVTTVVQDYPAMGEAAVEALTHSGSKKVQKFIPYRIEGLIQ